MQRKDGLETGTFFVGRCNLTKDLKNISYKNPHCAEFFCNLKNSIDCTDCANFLRKIKRMRFLNREFIKEKKEDYNFCKKNCNNGLVYDYVHRDQIMSNKCEVDQYKIMKNFYKKEFIWSLDKVPYKINYELTYQKPKTVVHWGQLKLLLETLFFLIKKIKPDEKEVTIIYAGSARGDNILTLSTMFPNIRWYLIDPRPHNKLLHNHPQVKEIITAFFTDETALLFYNKFKNRNNTLLFISDIRVSTDDKSVLLDQQNQANWHKIIKPEYSYFKFRCGYETEKKYKYYKGDIYIQPYAPTSSTESRILFPKELEDAEYDIDEYQGKFVYFNRVIRPAFYVKSLIEENNMFDHCYDCTYFSYLIKNYLNRFPNFNPFNVTDVYLIMKILVNKLSKHSQNKIIIMNLTTRNNLLN
jgi:hypothetical protein